MILFLDYDGVLHPDPCYEAGRLFENAPRLAAVLDHYPEVGVVLSTSWRNVKTQAELLTPLPERMRARVIGCTPNFSDCRISGPLVPYRRHAECAEWLRQHDMASAPWWALDDRSDWFAPYSEHLLECDSTIGFTEQMAIRLASRFELTRKRAARDVDVEIV